MNIKDNNQNNGLNKYKWLKWLHRIVLFLAVIMPAFYTLFYFLYIKSVDPSPWGDWEVFEWMIFIAPFVLLTWFMPILGGILILVGTQLGLLYYLFASAFGDLGMAGDLLLPQYLILVTGGILSIAWGIVRRQQHYR